MTSCLHTTMLCPFLLVLVLYTSKSYHQLHWSRIHMNRTRNSREQQHLQPDNSQDSNSNSLVRMWQLQSSQRLWSPQPYMWQISRKSSCEGFLLCIGSVFWHEIGYSMNLHDTKQPVSYTSLLPTHACITKPSVHIIHNKTDSWCNHCHLVMAIITSSEV